METGKRNSDNAMIAAAALAAAADIPLPLNNKKNEGLASLPGPNAIVGSNSTPSVLPSRQKGPINILNPANATVVKSEDLALTEPEDDENRTEDEPVSELKESEKVELLKEAEKQPAYSTDSQLSSVPLTSDLASNVASQLSEPVPIPAVSKTVKEEKTKFRPPPLHAFKVDPDSGIIGCICGIEEDDGFTIQCDICFRWQHCSCMGYKTNEEVPEDVYKCYFCDSEKWNKFDPQKCREDTLARLETDRVSEPPKLAPPKRKTLSSGSDDKKRRKLEKEAKAERPTAEKRKSSSSAVANSPQTATSPTFDINNKDNPLLEDGVSAEQYQGVYYKLEDNDYKTVDVRRRLAAIGEQIEKSKDSQIQVTSLAAYKQIKLSKVILPNHQKYLQERKEIRRAKGYNDTSVQVKAYSENPKQKFVGISKIGLFISKRAELADGDVIPAGTPVVEYLGEVDMLELYMGNAANQYSAWGTVKPQVARVDLPYLAEKSVSIVLDARFVGNEARFIRKLCPSTANCEIKSFYIPQQQVFKHVVYTTRPITLKGEEKEEELRLKWEWDEAHPINKMLVANKDGAIVEGQKFDDFSDEEKVLLVLGVDTILNFVECACNTTAVNLQCAIFKIKKATSYLLRSTRKAANLTNIAFNKSKEELVMPKKHKQFILWKERLNERDNMLHMSIFSIDNEQDTDEVEDEVSVLDETIEPENRNGELEQAPQKLPYKRQLLARAKAFASRKYVTEPDKEFDNTTHVPKIIAVPLVPDMLVTIKESVNETLKPLAKISSNVNIVAKNEVVPITETEPVKGKESSPVAAKEAAPEVKAQAPPVVKKLSFADYKKKMK